MTNRVGRQFGNYHLMRLLGQGRFAEVYLGEHVHLATQAAIKVLHISLTDPDVEGFRAEARTIAHLEHPHIVRVLEFGIEGGLPFLVMSYAPHGSLRQRYPTGMQLPLDIVVSYVKQVADALQYLHDQRLIHRDIKPENLLLGRRHEVLVSDFGLALLVQSTSYQQVQELSGTVGYMAPELFRAQASPASDQYALGVVVYEWLSGARPFAGLFAEIAVRQMFMAPPSLHEQMPMLPPVMEQVVLQALAKDPQQRFASVQAFALALEEAYQAASSGRTVLVPVWEQPAHPEGLSKSSLPILLTSFIGREQEVAMVCAQLSRPEVRFVTLVGTGGIGKTRLSLQVATAMQGHFAEGVCFVPLATIRDPELVVPTVAQALRIRESGTQPLLEQVKEALHNSQLLLLLDNVEQVVAVMPRVEDLLASCPRLKILVTSRALLHLPAEQVFPVPPLALPDLVQLPAPEQLMQFAAVALFIQRAQAILPSFQLTPGNARAVAEICARLDGLPLAIELAAARIHLLPPQALLARLSQRLQVLTSGAPTLSERQQTLRNTLKWSYDLLEAREQQLFRRLAVFVHGWTLEAAEALCGAGQEPGRAAWSVLEGVASLLDKSLLLQMEQEGEPRFIMLETVREYGLECLAAAGELEGMRQVHAAYYLVLAEAAAPELEGPAPDRCLERLERAYDNLRAAMQWMMEQGEIEMALRVSGALQKFWLVRGHWSEEQDFLKQALAKSEGSATLARAKALSAAANIAFKQDEYDQGEGLAEESLALYRELRDTPGIAFSLYLLGNIARLRSNYVAARSLTEQALGLWRELGDQEKVAWSLSDLAILVTEQGEYSRGRTLFEESLEMHRELGNKRGIALSLLRLGWVDFYAQNDPATARLLLEEGLALFRALGDKENIANSDQILGLLILQQGDAALARSLAEQSRGLSREIGDRQGDAESLFLLARVATFQGEHTAARALYLESLALCKEAGNNKWNIAVLLEGLANVVAAQGEAIWAARLWGTAESLRDTIGAPIPPVLRATYDPAVAAARASLGEKTFASAWAEGRTMTPKQALAAQGQMGIPTVAPAGSRSAPLVQSPATSPAGLTAREAEVLRLLARGLTNQEIASALVVSERTVNSHLVHIFNKLGVNNRVAAVTYAIRHELTE